jgi:hypothetical protein
MSTCNLFLPDDAKIRNASLIGNVQRSERKVSIYVTDISDDDEANDRRVIGSMRVHRVRRAPESPSRTNGDVSNFDSRWVQLDVNEHGRLMNLNVVGESNEFDCVNVIRYKKCDLAASAFLLGPDTTSQVGDFVALARILQSCEPVRSSEQSVEHESESCILTSVRKSALKVCADWAVFPLKYRQPGSLCTPQNFAQSSKFVGKKYFFVLRLPLRDF